MNNETAAGSAGASDRPGHPGGSPRQQSPLQARAQFLQNRSWELVVGFNRGACERGRAQHGINRETHEKIAAEWQSKQSVILSLDETLEFLRYCHRQAPFLFFNGNTFAEVGRRVAAILFSELPPTRLRQVTSAVAHFIAGVLDREAMVEIVESLCEASELKPGDRVKTFRGSLRGTIVKVLEDGRVVLQPDGDGHSELMTMPESLIKENDR